MHSRIFQVSAAPIAKEDYISSADYEDHWFTREIADYVSDNCDRDSDIEWLKSDGLEIGTEKERAVLIVKDKHAFFNAAYESFRESLKEAEAMTIDDFCKIGTSFIPFRVKHSYEDKYGFYIEDENELKTLDSWVRLVKEGDVFYIGGTVDYHS